MSTQTEKINAQKAAFESGPTQPWHRHLIGPAELRNLFLAQSEANGQGLTLAILCDVVLGENAEDRSDEDLIWAVGELIRERDRLSDLLETHSTSNW